MAKPLDTRKVASFYIWALVGAASMYGFRFLLARSLAPTTYGLFYAVIAFISTLSLVNDLGFNQSFIYHFTESRRNQKDVFTLTLLIRTGLATLLALFLILAHSFLAKHFFHEPRLAGPILIFALFFYIEELFQTLLAYHGAVNHYATYARTVPLSRLLLFLSALVVTLFSANHQVALYLTLWVGSIAALIPLLIKGVPFARLLTTHPSWQIARPLTTFALTSALGGVGARVLARFDTLLITFFRGATEVGYYEVAIPLTTIFLTLITPFATFLFPSLAQYYHAGKQKALSHLFLLIQRVDLFLLLPFSLLLALFAKEVIVTLFGRSYVAAAPALIILSVAVFFQAFGNFNILFLNATGKVQRTNVVLWGGALLNILLNILFIPAYGFVAAAWTTLISYLLMFGVGLWFLRHQFRLALPWRSWLFTGLTGGTAIVATKLLKGVLLIPLYLKALVIGGFFLLLYYGVGILLFRIVTFSELRDYFFVLLPKPLLSKLHFKKA